MNQAVSSPTVAPWGTTLGTSGNTRAAPYQTKTIGRPLWSLPLPERAASSIVVAPDGLIIVATERHASALTPRGQLAWVIEAPLVQHPIVGPDGTVIVYDGAGLSVRERTTGTQRAHIPTNIITAPTATPTGDLVFADYDAHDRAFFLVCTTIDGVQQWKQPLAGPPTGPIIRCDDRLFLSDGRFLRVCTLDGAALWTLDAADTRLITSVFPNEQAAGAQFRFPLVQLTPSLVLAQVEHTAGYGYLLIDVLARAVGALDTHLPPGAPLAVAAGEHDPCLITLDWPQQSAEEAWRSAVIAVTLNGQQAWSHEVGARPLAISTDSMGMSFIVCSPSLDYWDKYRDWYHLEDECFVRCLTPTGAEQWTWKAPGPLSPLLAVGITGEVYCVADGQVWGIG